MPLHFCGSGSFRSQLNVSASLSAVQVHTMRNDGADCLKASLQCHAYHFFLSQNHVHCPSQWGWCLTPQLRSHGRRQRNEWRSSLPTPGMLLNGSLCRYQTVFMYWNRHTTPLSLDESSLIFSIKIIYSCLVTQCYVWSSHSEGSNIRMCTRIKVCTPSGTAMLFPDHLFLSCFYGIIY